MPKPAASNAWCLWPLVVAAPLWARAEPMIEPTAKEPEFLDFLEYLGSWEGEEQDWVQFLEVEGLIPPLDAAEEERDEHEESDDAVS